MSYLSKKNIPVLIVWADKLTYDPKTVLKIARTCKKKLQVINGDGTETTRGLNDIVLDD